MNAPDPYSPPEARLVSGANESRRSSLSLRARLGRVRFLVRLVSVPIVAFIVWMVFISTVMGVSSAGSPSSGLIGVGVTVLVSLMVVALFLFTVQRLNDVGRHGAWSLVLLAPVLNVVALIGLVMWPGEPVANNCGPPPPPPGASLIALGIAVSMCAAVLGLLLWVGMNMPADF